MKKNCLFYFLIFISSLSFGKKTFPGYYITNNNDTVWGEFKVKFDYLINQEPFIYYLQYKVSFIDSSQKIHKFKPGQIKGFCIFTEKENYLFTTIENVVDVFEEPSEDTLLFANILVDDYLKLFRIYYDSPGSGGGSYMNSNINSSVPLTNFGAGKGYKPRLLIQSPNSKPLVIRSFYFKKDILEFISDYTLLSEKITSKEYKYDDMKKIVSEYNSWKEAIDEKLK